MSCDQLLKWTKVNDIWAVAVVETVDLKPTAESQEEIHSLLQEFKDLFEQPTTLPPARSYDHQIPLLPNSVPVNSRPYKYSTQYKDEIERQVKNC
jgi:hypothetical protein